MVFSMAAWLCAVLSVATLVHGLGRAETPTKVVHEKRNTVTRVHDKWIKKGRAEASAPLTLRIGLKQRNLERAEEFMNAVSHPRSETYGKHWTPEEVAEAFAPSDEAVAETEQWLIDEGIATELVSKGSDRAWIRLHTTVGVVETLLDAVYDVYENEDGLQIIACGSYSVLAAIRGHIDLIVPTVQFDERESVWKPGVEKPNMKGLSSAKIKKLPPSGIPGVDSSESFCSDVMASACLQALYNMPMVKGGAGELTLENNSTDMPIFLDVVGDVFCDSGRGATGLFSHAGYPDQAALPGAPAGPPPCSLYRTTGVIVLPHRNSEDAFPASYQARQCSEYMKLGLMGVTVVSGSGDAGTAGLGGQCVGRDGTDTPGEYGRFTPVFPNTCPWITSVGGTALPQGGSVGDREIMAYEFQSGGGFSDMFRQPAYQANAVKKYYDDHDPGYDASQYNNSRRVRGYPDVALASQNYQAVIGGEKVAVSGTWVSSSILGEMILMINRERTKVGKGPVGFMNTVLYEHPELFVDVVKGGSRGCGFGFDAVDGWDPASGLGTTDYEMLKKVFMALP
ncbi:Pro-kumamolisin, activation domain-containing protein [Lasiosphaeris hirsuta]|uniref:Pro-kumamolisin, activation domain-containing protein n=1 Tax=Lasiosphaeris hirsuta TaxID=260670 RepID=A0AA40B9P1_9PEZI|nr:Pro-kumamolisin, activation domain-containing protein [Lasiosphaeris hirsuta]